LIDEAPQTTRVRPVGVIRNPASGGGTSEDASLRAALEDMEPDWVSTEKPRDAREAVREWRAAAGGNGQHRRPASHSRRRGGVVGGKEDACPTAHPAEQLDHEGGP
jgi:hypothetical protein